MKVSPLYNRSEIYSFFDLSDSQKENVLNDMTNEEAENDSFVILKGKKFENILPLSMFMRINYGSNVNNKPIFWDGVYGTSYFSAYFIKLSKCGSCCVVAERYS